MIWSRAAWCKLIKRVLDLEGNTAQPLVCDQFCPVVVGELENVDGPLNLNPEAPTAVTWGGWQSQDNAVVAVSGTQAEIVSDDVCAVNIEASITFVNLGAASNAQRAHPEVWLLRNGQRRALAQIYIRDFSGQDSDTANIGWWDLNPIPGTVYSLEVQQDSIDTGASGQTTAALEAFRDVEIANFMQVAAHRRFKLCCPETDGEGGEGQLVEQYVIRQWQDNGFFNTDQMNGQIQIFNTGTTPGPANWELRFDSNYDITQLNPTGATAGAIQQTDNGTDYSYVIPMSGAIPGNNGNVQIAIVGTRHPQSTDTQATHTNQGIFS